MPLRRSSITISSKLAVAMLTRMMGLEAAAAAAAAAATTQHAMFLTLMRCVYTHHCFIRDCSLVLMPWLMQSPRK